MASWLKVAEDLLEVVDRRAKSVARDSSEEQFDTKLPASNVQEHQGKKKKRKEKLGLSTNKPTKRSEVAPEQTSLQELQGKKTTPEEKVELSTNELTKRSEDVAEQTSLQASGDNGLTGTDVRVLSSQNAGAMSIDNTLSTSKELQLDVEQDDTMSGVSIPDRLPNDVFRTDENINSQASDAVPRTDDTNDKETSANVNDLEAVSSSSNGEISVENMSNGHELPAASVLVPSGVETVNGDHPTDMDIPLKVDPEGSEVGSGETDSNTVTQAKDADVIEEPPLDLKKKQESKDDTPSRMQEQLDEAQGLLKSAVSTGPSKEARLARVCAGLSSRLQEYKSENAQLEELLTAERERTNSYELRLKQLQKDLSASKIEVSRVESNMVEALGAKNSEIEALVNSMDAVKKQATMSEGKLASLQANMESIMRNRELTETRVMQALREELTSAERRAEEEHVAHKATKKAAMEREVELEHRAVEASTALARMQRNVDERTSKVAELEQKLALLEAESASLNQELQDMEARARRGQKRSTDEANQVVQVQAWQEEVERARQGQRDAETKLSSLEAEVQKMRVEMSGMKRDAEHYSRQEHLELEKRYRELTDLLYHKQTQLETMASEKAAAEFQLEVEMGIGCGVGFGHGFGAGVAVKPGVVHHLQSCFAQALVKLMTKFGSGPGLLGGQSMVAESLKSKMNMVNSTETLSPLRNAMQLALSQEHTSRGQANIENLFVESTQKQLTSNGAPLDSPFGSHTEKVISSFLQNPILKDERDTEPKELVGRLRRENDVLQLVLKHQQVIDTLIAENEKLRQVLIEELKVPASKLEAHSVSGVRSQNPCSDCFECRRRQRKLR